jgi:2-furoyl-CoA dehydrogenase large subunit
MLETQSGGVRINYTYEASVGGKVAMVGARLLDGAARVIIGQFFAALGRQASGAPSGFTERLRSWFGGRS